MAKGAADFTLDRTLPQRAASTPLDEFIQGQEPEGQLAVRVPLRLLQILKIHAAQTHQTQKEIVIRLIEAYLAQHAEA
jgi:hypothetical protein